MRSSWEMANLLAQYESIKISSGRFVVCIEDVNDVWGIVKEGFEARVPFRKAWLNSKARNPVIVDQLPVEYILTTDSRLRSRISYDPSPFLFRQPYATVVLVTCEDFDEYKTVLKPRLRTIVQNEDREWFIVFVSKAHLATDQAGKLTRRIYSKLEVDFSSKKRERCCKLDMHVADAAVWEDVERKMVECIRFTLERRVQFYEEETRKLSENRFSQSWSFCNFFIMKESLAFMFEMAHMQDDALREYDELEQCFMELVNTLLMKSKDFGGLDRGDDCAAILQPNRKALNQIVHDEFFREFDFRQYLFARQALLLFQLNRSVEVAARGFSFVISFSRILSQDEKNLPFCLREVWVITACMKLVKETAARFSVRSVTPDVEKEFYRLQADLYSLARVKLMRLADLIGYGKSIQRSPCNSAALSMLPWPKPAVWPHVPADAGSRILMKEQDMEEQPRPFGISRKLLPLAPSLLLREANRRRASLSAGNTSEMLEYRLSSKESMVGDGNYSGSPPYSAAASPVRTNSGPLRSLSPGSGAVIDRPMRLAEIQAAAEHALHQTVTDEKLRLSLSSVQSFEELYLEITRLAADNYHRSWRKRHGVVLDGEVAALHYRRGNYDSASKLYEKVCALYAGEGWHGLLAEVLPNLAECQKQLGHLAGYLLSCVKLLSLEAGLLLDQERHTLQVEILRLAHSALKDPVSVDVSALITFSAKGGPPLYLCEGDPGNLLVSVWSGFPAEISLDTLNLTLIATFAADEGTKVVTTSKPPLLKPGKNNVLMVLPPQRPGSYVLGVLTGQLGQIRLRSHTYCTTSAVSSKGGSPESDDYLSLEKPLRPVLQVARPRALVDIAPVISWGLLMGEPQWLGLIIKPIDYSLEGAILYLSPGPGLCLGDPQQVELEIPSKLLNGTSTEAARSDEITNCEKSSWSLACIDIQDKQFLEFKNGAVGLPDGVSNKIAVLWIRVRAVQDKTHVVMTEAAYDPSSEAMVCVNGTRDKPTVGDLSLVRPVIQVDGQSQSSTSQRHHSTGLRKLDVRLGFGAARSRMYERTVSVQFLEPLQTVTRVVSKGNESSVLLQVVLISQLNATITIVDAHLELQSGYTHTGNADGRPSPSSILPLVLSPSSESALIFMAQIETPKSECDELPSHGQSATMCCQMTFASTLSIHYEILGDRTVGAHSPSICSNEDIQREVPVETRLVYKCNLVLDMPVVEPLLAVGMLALPSDNPRVGQQFLIRWRIERLKEGYARLMQAEVKDKSRFLHYGDLNVDPGELFYEIDLNPDNWMISGRKKGYVCLPLTVGGRVTVSVACVPLVAGYVRPPALSLPYIDRAQISCTPAGPHLICVLPPVLSSTFCIAQRNLKLVKG